MDRKPEYAKSPSRLIARATPCITIAALIAMTVIVGCAVGPDFKSPQTIVPDGWFGPTSRIACTQPVSQENLARWWTIFNDQTMTGLIDDALQHNLDMRIARSRIRQARAARGMSVAALGPALTGGASYQRGRGSTDIPDDNPPSQRRAGDDDGITRSPISNQYQAGFDASWEIDVFGGTRRSVEAADADLQYAIEDMRDVQITLAAEMARNYVELRTYQQRIDIARRNLTAQQRNAQVTQQKFDAGLVSSLDVVNAKAQVASTKAQIPLLESSAQQTIYAISVMLDRPPAELVEKLSPIAEIPTAPPRVPMGVPSDLLRRRPDIRRAEASIHSATANIGVAVADLYPRFSIGGSLGWNASNPKNWFDPLSMAWSFGPSMSWNLFKSGSILSNIEVKRALEEQTILAYRQTVLAAVQEVENNLIAAEMEQEHRLSLAEAVDANRKATEISTKLYAEGHTDFLNVLSAQRSLFSSEDSLAQSNSAVSTYLIALYKAMGGGWDANPTRAAKETPPTSQPTQPATNPTTSPASQPTSNPSPAPTNNGKDSSTPLLTEAGFE